MIKSAVNVLATWAWGNDINVDSGISADFCLENIFPIPPTPCIIALVMKTLGICIILGACLNKAPVINNILRNKSVAGMSISSVYSETIMYANSAFYSVLNRNPFTAYGETLILTFQSMIVCTLSWTYSQPKISIFQRFMAIVVFCVYLFGVFFVLTPEYYSMLHSVNLPVLLFSRGSQIYAFFNCKHTGTQSLITTTMNMIGSAIRVATTISEIGFDIPMLSGYVVSLVLNLILIAQFLLYKKQTDKYLASLKKKAD